MTNVEKRAWVRLAYMAGMGREPESEKALAGWANQIADDGSNLEAVAIVPILDSTESVAYRAAIKQARTGPQGPQGPQGPKGDPGAAVVAPGTTITSTVK